MGQIRQLRWITKLRIARITAKRLAQYNIAYCRNFGPIQQVSQNTSSDWRQEKNNKENAGANRDLRPQGQQTSEINQIIVYQFKALVIWRTAARGPWIRPRTSPYRKKNLILPVVPRIQRNFHKTSYVPVW